MRLLLGPLVRVGLVPEVVSGQRGGDDNAGKGQRGEPRELAGRQCQTTDDVDGAVDTDNHLRVSRDQVGGLRRELGFCFVDERLRGFG